VSEEERPDQIEAAADYVDALLKDRKPRPPRGLKGEDAQMLRMAALLASTRSPRSQPSAAFVRQLRERIRTRPRPWWELSASRRGLLSGLAAAAAAAATAAIGRGAWQRSSSGGGVPNGWVPIAQAAELPPGTVKRFTAGGVEGHVVNIGGKIWALSAICTHQACELQWRAEQQEFLCPCHGAEFDTSGEQTGTETYGLNLPPLPRIPVQQANGTIYAIPAQAARVTAPPAWP
jgi:nitrite reductase/ring-hydroxylating ferredoxin subunit